MEEIKKHKFILMCGDNIHSLGILRSLGEVGIVPIVILLEEGHRKLLSHSKYAKVIFYSNSFKESLDILLTYSNEKHKPFVLTTDDNHEQLLDENYDKLQDHFIFYNGGKRGRLTEYMDKAALCEAAEQCGIKIPKGEMVKPGEIPTKLTYPIFTKTINSYSSGWKRDVFICNNLEEYLDACKTMISPALLVQEYIEKENEVSMQGFSINGGASIYIPYEKRYVRFSSTSFGSYMYYDKFENEELRTKIEKLIRHIGFSGCFEIEFIEGKDGELYFLEINFRTSASNYGVNYGGVNLPLLWAKASIDQNFNELLMIIKLRNSRYYVMNEPADIRCIRQVGYFRWFKQLFCADSWYLFNSKDIKPMVYFWAQKLSKINL